MGNNAEAKTAMLENRMQSECLRTAIGSRLRDPLSSHPGDSNGYIEGNAQQSLCVCVSMLIKSGRVLCPRLTEIYNDKFNCRF